jgi:tetratricopeptide (TPR) repeat protein
MSSSNGGSRILTFYSYKGGTGRSMAVANLAWVLAANRKRVLLMDWDLEAPGLHRYFHPFLADKELATSRGLVDLLADYADQAIQPPQEGEGDDWYLPLTDLSPYLSGINFAGFPEGGRIDLLPSGRQGPGYAAKLHAFDWDTFYERLGGGTFLEAIKARLRQDYDYVLIDSRTGVSDTAGICTVQMPDVLVAMFTYNNQSIRGALAVAQSAVETRRRTYGQFSRETFRVFPVPSRADPFEVRKLQLRQAYARRLFDPLLDHLPEREHNAYWAGVEVPYNAFLNYEEVLSPLIFNPDDPKLPLASVLRLASQVTDGDVTRYDLPLSPEARRELLAAYERVDEPPSAADTAAETATAGSTDSATPANVAKESPADALLRAADTVLGQLNAKTLNLARRLLLRLVRHPRSQESPGLKRMLLPVTSVPAKEQPFLDKFVQAGVLRLVQAQEKGGTPAVEIAEESLLARWRQLNEWATTEKFFLEQRDWIQAAMGQWQRAGQPDTLLLADPLAEQADRVLRKYAPLLTSEEIAFVKASRRYRSEQSEKEIAQTVSQIEVISPPTPYAPKTGNRLPGWVWVLLVALPLVLGGLYWQSSRPGSSPDGVSLPPPDATVPQPTAAEAAIGFNIAGEQSLTAGRVEEAIGNFDTALKLRPDFPEALFNRARAFELKNQAGKAIADLRAGLELRPEQADARLRLAGLLARGKDKQGAIQVYKAAMTLNLTLEQRQEADKALEWLDPAPARPRIFLHINNRGDYGFAERLGMDLKSAGMQVRDIQVLTQSTRADVRYANAADLDLASNVRAVVQATLAQAGYPHRVDLLFIGDKFDKVSRGTIEVWLPPLAPLEPPAESPMQRQALPKAAR